MREGRSRPSLCADLPRPVPDWTAAMREGRSRPSLNFGTPGLRCRAVCRNEGGAKPPLVATGVPGETGGTRLAAMREGRSRPSLQCRSYRNPGIITRRNEGGAKPPLVVGKAINHTPASRPPQ